MNREQSNKKGKFKGTSVDIAEGQSFERALKAFNKKVQDAGILKEIRDRQHYEKPSEKRKRNRQMARKRWLKKQSKVNPDIYGTRSGK